MKLAIYGYGNLGRGAESNICSFPDIELTGVFTRRAPETVKTLGAPVYSSDSVLEHSDDIDVLLVAGGSASDLPVMTPELARHFNVVDSFDNHHRIASHFENVDISAKETGHTALISTGWDPGLFSILKLYSQEILPEGSTYTFWGRGVSQGHSDAIRRIDGVLDAKQYTVPRPEAVDAVKSGRFPEPDVHAMHIRECYVVASEGADRSRIEHSIKTMPDYFEGYETHVHFISREEMLSQHSKLPHGGFVLRSGFCGGVKAEPAQIGFNLEMASNPDFTSSVLLAFCRAVYRLHVEGKCGCLTVLDIAPRYLSALSDNDLRSKIL